MKKASQQKGLLSGLIGHRGLPLLAPENTQASIECAAENNIEWIELDVTMLGDDSLIMMHDSDLSLFKQPEIKLLSLNSESIRKIDAGAWFSSEFIGEPLIDLKKTFELIIQTDLKLNLEIKINPDIEVSKQVKVIYDGIKNSTLEPASLVVSSFNLAALTHLRALDEHINIAPLFEKLPETLTDTYALKPVSIHCDQSQLKQAQAIEIVQELPLYCYTVNDTVTLKKLLSWGVSGVFSDRAHAQELRAVVQSFNLS